MWENGILPAGLNNHSHAAAKDPAGQEGSLDQQKKYAEQVGIDAYLDEFSNWFSSNTTGSCSK